MIWAIFGLIDVVIIWWIAAKIRKPSNRNQSFVDIYGFPRIYFYDRQATRLERQMEEIYEWQQKQI